MGPYVIESFQKRDQRHWCAYNVGWADSYLFEHMQILREERYLTAVFGEEYLNYCLQVPNRYLGRRNTKFHSGDETYD